MSGDFAVVIVGGGPAGAATAITLARLGHRVILVDDNAGGFKIGEALAPAARPLLVDLGVMHRFLSDGHLPCYANVSAWGSWDAQYTDFILNPHGHGWHLDRVRFDAMLHDEARSAGVEVLPEARFASAKQEHDGWRITLRTGAVGQELHGGWLIDATGRRSVVARHLGAERIHDDRLIAFFIRCRLSEGFQHDADSRTFIEAAPDGWWYSALVPSGERIVAFLTDRDLADRTALKTATGFMDLLARTQLVGNLLNSHRYRPDGDPRGADAGTARLDRFGGAGWLAVGDAALSFDPLSSLGILNALFTGVKAGHAVAEALSDGPGFIHEYSQRLESIYSAYRTNRNSYYAAEKRWSDRPFWQRRSNH